MSFPSGFSVIRLNTLEEKYQNIEELGGGTYGLVTKSIDVQTNKTVALKEIKFNSREEGFPQTTLREVFLLRELDHVNIVHLENVIQVTSTRKVYLVFEYC